jgi:hypothetical protein
MTRADLRRRRAAAQLLVGKGAAPDAAASPRGAVAHLLAVQAQDLRAARLALRARGAASAAAEVDAALGEERSLVIAWLMRGTLHLVAREDHGWLHALCAGQGEAAGRRRLGQLGVGDPERGVRVIERALADEGPLGRPALAERLRAAGVRAEGQAVPHLLALAARRGTVVRAGDGFALAEDWLGPVEAPPDRDAALAELARRYLRGHGPATAADVAAWSGVGLRDARAGLAAVADELAADGELVDLAGRTDPAPSPPRLLPAFDPYLLGWKDRSFAVDPAHARRVRPGGGMIRATAVVDGCVVGTWTMPGGRVALEPFGALDAGVEGALAEEGRRIERF